MFSDIRLDDILKISEEAKQAKYYTDDSGNIVGIEMNGKHIEVVVKEEENNERE